MQLAQLPLLLMQANGLAWVTVIVTGVAVGLACIMAGMGVC